jgi:beta-galactosidase
MKRTAILLTIAILYGHTCLAEVPRKILMLDEYWKFINEDVWDASLPDLDNSGWETVSVPYDWAIGKPFDMNIDWQETKGRPVTGLTGALPTFGVGWYRRAIFIPEEDEGKRVFVEFDGVMSLPEVFLNGGYIGEWKYGYSSFSLELTDHVKFGQENLLAVCVENRTASARWYTGAGIYRNVRLVTTEPVHVAHWGTYITTPEVSSISGTVSIQTKLRNQSGSDTRIELVTEIMDPAGKKVSSVLSKKSMDGDEVFVQRLNVKNPKLWDLHFLWLYKTVSRVYAGNELLTDRFSQLCKENELLIISWIRNCDY